MYIIARVLDYFYVSMKIVYCLRSILKISFSFRHRLDFIKIDCISTITDNNNNNNNNNNNFIYPRVIEELIKTR